MPLEILYSPESIKELQRLPGKLQGQIVRKVEQLATHPEGGSVKRLHGQLRDYFRVRAGDHRIWFFVSGSTLHIVRITDRKDGYD